MRESICYTKIFKYPIKIYSIKTNKQQFTLSKKGIEIYRIVFTIIACITMYNFRFYINKIIPDLLKPTVYFILPYVLSGYVVKKIQGKNIIIFLKDYFQYLFIYKNYKYVNPNTKDIKDIYEIDHKMIFGNIKFER